MCLAFSHTQSLATCVSVSVSVSVSVRARARARVCVFECERKPLDAKLAGEVTHARASGSSHSLRREPTDPTALEEAHKINRRPHRILRVGRNEKVGDGRPVQYGGFAVAIGFAVGLAGAVAVIIGIG